MPTSPLTPAPSPNQPSTPEPGAPTYARAIGALDRQDPAAALNEVKTARTGLDAIERQAVAMARDHRMSWVQIATLLAITRQAAHHRHPGSRSPRRLPERNPPHTTTPTSP